MTGFRHPNDDLEIFPHEKEEQEKDDDDDNGGNDTARGCIGWEDNMTKNGQFFSLISGSYAG